MDDTKKWYESKGVWGGVIAVLAAIAAPVFGVTIDEIEQGNLVDIAVGIAGVIGGALAAWGRIRATKTISGE